MRNLFAAFLILCGLSSQCAAQMPMLGAGSPIMGGAPPSYTGPGDVVSSAIIWLGLRAYSAASAGSAALNACNVGDAACADLSTNSATGDLAITTIGGAACSVAITSGTYSSVTGAVVLTTAATPNLSSANHFALSAMTGTGSIVSLNGGWTSTTGTTGTTVNFTAPTGLTLTITGGTISVCTVKTLYDRSGANSCSSAACNVTQATIANRPILTVNCLNSTKPCMTFSGASMVLASSSSPTQAQPFTYSSVAQYTGACGSAFCPILVSDSAGNYVGTGFDTGTNKFDICAASGCKEPVAASISTWYSDQAVFNGASSLVYQNGSSNTVASTPGASSMANTLEIGNDTFSENMVGQIGEIGVWGIGFNSTQQSNMNSNQRSYWGF